MNKFRSKLLSGEPLNEPLLRPKTSREVLFANSDNLEGVRIARAETRRADHRDNDRHRLSNEMATARWNGAKHSVELVNLSGGGAMIACDFHPNLWDRIDLTLGDCDTVETAVRWIRGDRIGLEFAHETRIDADLSVLDATLRAVLARSFPDVAIDLSLPEASVEEQPKPAAVQEGDEPEQLISRRDGRHPLIWMGLVHFNHDSFVVRLRNISGGGALVESSGAFPVGSELLLDLDEAGSLFATVHWSRGDQCGLRFHTPFDLAALANARPKLTPARWNRPDYLREEGSDASPWAAQWKRLSLSELKSELEGFLKR